MDSLSTGIVRIVIEDPGVAAPSGRAPSKGGSYDPNASSPARPSQAPPTLVPAPAPPVPRPVAPPPPSSDGTSYEEKIRAILRDPGAKQSLGKGTTAEEVAKMGPAFIDLLYNEIGKAKSDYKPVVAAAPPPPRVDAPIPRKTESGDVVPVRIVAPSPIPVVITGGQAGGAKPSAASVAAAPSPMKPEVVPEEEPAPNFDWIKQMIQTAPTLANASKAAAQGELDRTPYGLASETPTFQVVPPEPQPLPKPIPIKHEAYDFAPAPAPESKPQPSYELAPEVTPKPESDTFGFEKPKVETFGFKKPTAYPVPKPEEGKIPLADSAYRVQDPEKLAVPRPQARVVTDAEKSRDQWKPENLLGDFKNYLPASITSKFDKMGAAYKAASAEAGANGAGMAGRAMAGAGEAIVAAGPVAAFAAIAVAAHASAKAHQKAADSVEGMGNQAARFAANDHLGMFNASVDAAKDTLREIPIVGQKYAAELSLAVAPIKAFTTAVNGFVARGRELQGYNGSLAGANARADVRSLMGDLREAKELGPALARLTEVESRANDELRALLLPIKEVVVNRLAGLAETLLDAWDFVKPIFTTIGEAAIGGLEILQQIAEMLAKVIPGGEGLLKLIQKIIDNTKDKRPNTPDQGPIVDWLNAADGLGRSSWDNSFSNNNGNAAQRQVAGPMFPGFGDALGM